MAGAEVEVETGAEAGVMSRNVGSGVETVWWKGVLLTPAPP